VCKCVWNGNGHHQSNNNNKNNSTASKTTTRCQVVCLAERRSQKATKKQKTKHTDTRKKLKQKIVKEREQTQIKASSFFGTLATGDQMHGNTGCNRCKK